MFTQFHKRLILIIAICLLVIAAGGLMRASAGQDTGAMLENWFNGKKTQSVNEIDAAIEAEKSRLMGELQSQLDQSIGGAAKEIENFTDAEKARRIQALREYAATLMAGIGQGGADWDKQAYLGDVQKAVDKAMDEIEKAAEKAKSKEGKNQPKKEVPPSQPDADKQPDQQPSTGSSDESVKPEAETPAKESVNTPEKPEPPAASQPQASNNPAENSQTAAPPEAPPADAPVQEASAGK